MNKSIFFAIVLSLILSTALFSAKTIEVYLQNIYDPTQYPETSKILEEIVDEYERLHPDIKIVLIPAEDGGGGASGTEYNIRTWLTARMAAGNPPHIAWEQYYMRPVQKGWWIPLDIYLDLPNPYFFDKSWKESIYDHVWRNVISPDGHYYTLAMDWVETGFYYNKEIFNKLNLPTNFESWEEFISTLDKLKNSEYVPFVAQEWGYFQWADDILMSAFWNDKVPEMFLEETGRTYKGREWRMLTVEEVAKAIYDGTLNAYDERFKNYLETLKEWSKYWAPGYSVITETDALTLFLSEQAAIFWSATGAKVDIEKSASFDWGITYFPPITCAKEYLLPEFSDVSFRVGGPSSVGQYGITIRAQNENLIEECVDFLMYLSTPETFGKVLAIDGRYLPMIVGTEVSQQLKYFAENVATLPERAFPDPAARLTPEQGARYKSAIQNFLVGTWNIERTQREIQEGWENAVEILAKENSYGWYK